MRKSLNLLDRAKNYRRLKLLQFSIKFRPTIQSTFAKSVESNIIFSGLRTAYDKLSVSLRPELSQGLLLARNTRTRTTDSNKLYVFELFLREQRYIQLSKQKYSNNQLELFGQFAKLRLKTIIGYSSLSGLVHLIFLILNLLCNSSALICRIVVEASRDLELFTFKLGFGTTECMSLRFKSSSSLKFPSTHRKHARIWIIYMSHSE